MITLMQTQTQTHTSTGHRDRQENTLLEEGKATGTKTYTDTELLLCLLHPSMC